MKRLIGVVVVGAIGALSSLWGASYAQVYEFRAVVKTMGAQKGKLSPKKNPFLLVDSPQTIVYRKQASHSWKGLIWGCGCESFMGKWLSGYNKAVSGAVIWSTKKPYDIILLDDMHWHVFNAVDQQGTKCECAWTIGESIDTSRAFLSFAGFGTLKLKTVREDSHLKLDDDCNSYISSVEGNVSGWMPAPAIETAGSEAVSVCSFCGEDVVVEGQEGSINIADAWNPCPCASEMDHELTAVSGVWAIKYNATLSKRLTNLESDRVPSILDIGYSFPAHVKTAIGEKISATQNGEKQSDDEAEEDMFGAGSGDE